MMILNNFRGSVSVKAVVHAGSFRMEVLVAGLSVERMN